MDQQRARWRIRLSSLMPLVIIAGLALALVMGQWRRRVAKERARVAEEQALEN